MPNYSLLINSEFKPYSFEELIKPYQIYGEAYKAQEATMNDLSLKAGEIGDRLNQTLDPDLYNLYQDYMGRLESAASDMASKGLSPALRTDVNNLKDLYGTKINPISKALDKRTEQALVQQDFLMKHPNAKFNRMAESTPVSEYMKNPDIGFQTIDGDTLTQEVFSQAQAYSNQILSENPIEAQNLLGKDYIAFKENKGFTMDQILKAINGDEDAPEALKSIVDNVVAASGIDNWTNPETNPEEWLANHTWAENMAKKGLFGAAGKDDYKIEKNWRTAENVRYSHSLSEQKAAREFPVTYNPKDSDGNNVGDRNYVYDTTKGIFLYAKPYTDIEGITHKAGEMVSGSELQQLLDAYGKNKNTGNNTGKGIKEEAEALRRDAKHNAIISTWKQPGDLTDNGYELYPVFFRHSKKGMRTDTKIPSWWTSSNIDDDNGTYVVKNNADTKMVDDYEVQSLMKIPMFRNYVDEVLSSNGIVLADTVGYYNINSGEYEEGYYIPTGQSTEDGVPVGVAPEVEIMSVDASHDRLNYIDKLKEEVLNNPKTAVEFDGITEQDWKDFVKNDYIIAVRKPSYTIEGKKIVSSKR